MPPSIADISANKLSDNYGRLYRAFHLRPLSHTSYSIDTLLRWHFRKRGKHGHADGGVSDMPGFHKLPN